MFSDLFLRWKEPRPNCPLWDRLVLLPASRPDSASGWERFRRGCWRCRCFHATLTRRPAPRQLQFHAAFTENAGSCAQLGFSLANVARGSAPASELLGHKRLHLALKRNAAPALAWTPHLLMASSTKTTCTYECALFHTSEGR